MNNEDAIREALALAAEREGWAPATQLDLALTFIADNGDAREWRRYLATFSLAADRPEDADEGEPAL